MPYLNDQRDDGALCTNPGTSKVHKQKMAITLFGHLKIRLFLAWLGKKIFILNFQIYCMAQKSANLGQSLIPIFLLMHLRGPGLVHTVEPASLAV